MKKLAKLLVLFLAVALLGGILAVAAFADSESGPWSPATDTSETDYSSISYGVWTSESEFEAGKAPTVAWFSSTEGAANYSMNFAVVAGGGYYRLYSDNLTQTAQFVPDVANTVIDYNGHSITAVNAHAWRSTKALTVKNGTHHTNQLIQGSASLTLENMTLVQNNNNFVYGFYGDLKFVNCKITHSPGQLNEYGSFFLDTADKGITPTLEFIGTSLNVTQANTNQGIFFVFNRLPSPYFTGTWTIFVDSKSSITGPDCNLLSLPNVKTGNEPAAGAHKIYFEEGAVLSDTLINKIGTYGLQLDGAYTTVSAKDASAFFTSTVVKRGTSDFTVRDTVAWNDVNITSLGAGYSCIGDPNAVWEPEEGANLTYAIWENEGLYLAGFAPSLVSNATTLPTSSGYVRVYGNGINASNPIVANGQTLVIDLLGKATFNITNSTVVKPGATFEVRNGAVSQRHQLDINADSNVTFVNLTYDVNYIGDAWIRNTGATLVRFDNCNITVNNPVGYHGLACGNTTGGSYTEFKATTINVTAQNAKLLQVTYNCYSKATNYVFTFDKDSKVTGNVSTYIALNEQLVEGVSKPFGNNIQYLYFEEGFSFASTAEPNLLNYPLTAYDAQGKVLPPVLKDNGTECVIKVVEVGTTTAITPYYVNEKADGTLYFSSEEIILPDWEPAPDTLWAAFDSEEAYKAGKYPRVESNGNLTSKSLDTLGNVYVRLFGDVTYSYEGEDNFFLISGQSVTIDLNNYTLRTVAGTNFNTANTGDNATIVLKNGNFVATNQFQGKRTNDVYFYGVNFTGTNFGYNDGADVLYFENSVLTLSSKLGFYLGVNTNAAGSELSFVNTDIILTSSSLATDKSEINSDSRNAVFYILYNENYHCNWNIRLDENSSLSCPNMKEQPIWLSLYVTASNGVPAGEMPKIYIEEGFEVDGAAALPNFNYVTRASSSASLVDSTDAEALDCLIAVVEPDGTTPVSGWNARETEKGFYKIVDASMKGAVSANLTLSTNFNLNLFADPTVVNDIKLNGVSIANGTWEGKDKYSVTFAAHEAAKELAFTVETVNGTFILRYSVLKYADELQSAQVSNDAKLLAKAAIAYVKEAYEYAGATAPAALTAFSTDGIAAQTAAGNENYTSAIAGVQLFLDDGVKILLKLSDSYTGTLSVGGKSYNVSGGTVDGSIDTIVIGYMKAKDLYDASVAIVTESGEEGAFTLAGYVANDTEAKELLDALYTYCYYADLYAEKHPNLD